MLSVENAETRQRQNKAPLRQNTAKHRFLPCCPVSSANTPTVPPGLKMAFKTHTLKEQAHKVAPERMYWVPMSDTLREITISSKTKMKQIMQEYSKAVKPGTSSCNSKTSSALCYNERGQKLRRRSVGGLQGSCTKSVRNSKRFPFCRQAY